LQAVPARFKSAVRLEGVVFTFEAVYPGHDARGSLELARGTMDVADAVTTANASQEHRTAMTRKLTARTRPSFQVVFRA